MRPESLYFLFSPITRIKGVGGATAQALQRLLPPATAMAGNSVPIVRDLLFHLPVSIVDRRATFPLNAAPDGAIGTFVVTVDEHIPPKQKRFGKQPYKVICSNESGDITLVFFNASTDYIKQSLPVGSQRVISGKCEHFDFRLQMTHPDIIAPVSQLSEVQKPEAIYPLTIGITSRRIGKIVADALAKLPELPEWLSTFTSPVRGEVEARSDEGGGESEHHTHPLPGPPPERGRGISWKSALMLAHHPQSEEDLLPTTPARMRLAYDEMLANQLHLALLRRNMQSQAGEVIRGNGTLTDALIKTLPYTLTAGQKKVLADISDNMASGRRMGRLLQGDVGSGKTIVALIAMLSAVEQGLQAALMVPTELIASQHYEVISKLTSPVRGEVGALAPGGGEFEYILTPSLALPPNGGGEIKIVLLTGSIKGKAREDVLADIQSARANIIIGTHALFQEHVEFKNLALAVIDEQHRFGVNQRMALSAKGNAPHILHMTATPIPRSLTMTLYGDMDISMLKEKPAGRQPIATRVIPSARYGEVMERLKAALDRGEKAYWICPLVEDEVDSGWLMVDGKKGNPSTINYQPSTDIAAAKSRFTEFKARFGDVVGLVHGRMKADERHAQMQKFAEGKTRLLVATTVVEVGVDVRDATIMVIERAERFGLSQLHQLRGRVGRGEKPSSCVLLYGGVGSGERVVENNSTQPSTLDPLTRLSILRESEDGFKIAEADLAQRGGGDLLGVRQSGMPRFIFADVFQHQELLAEARDDMAALLKTDPELKGERGKALEILLQLFGYERENG